MPDTKGQILYIPLIRNNQIPKTESRMVLPGAGGAGNGELLFDGYRISIWDDEKGLEMEGSHSHLTVWMYLMPLNYTLPTWLKWWNLYLF